MVLVLCIVMQLMAVGLNVDQMNDTERDNSVLGQYSAIYDSNEKLADCIEAMPEEAFEETQNRMTVPSMKSKTIVRRQIRKKRRRHFTERLLQAFSVRKINNSLRPLLARRFRRKSAVFVTLAQIIQMPSDRNRKLVYNESNLGQFRRGRRILRRGTTDERWSFFFVGQ